MPIGTPTANFRTASTANPTGTEPAGAVSGDLIVAHVVTSGTAVPTIATGWTSIFAQVSGTSFYVRLDYIVRGASAPSYVWTKAAAYYEVFTYRIPGADITTPIDQSANGGSGTTTLSTSRFDPPAVTPSVADCLILCGGVDWFGSGAGGWTAPASYTRISDNTVGNDGASAYRQLTGGSGVAENPAAFTQANNHLGDANWSYTLAIKPAAGGTTPVTVTPAAATAAFTAAASATAATSVTPAPSTATFAASATATAQTAVVPAAASAVFTSAATVTTAAPVDLGTVTAAAVFTAASLATAATAVVPAAATAVFSSSGAVTASPVVAGSASAVFSSSAAAAAPTVVVPAAASSVYGASAVVTTPGSVTSSTRLPLAGVGN